jgi:hypothetical protein
MIFVVKIFGLLMILLCIWGILIPKALMGWVMQFWRKPSGIYLAVAVRIGLGILFVLVADQTRFPGVFDFLGYFMIIAAVMISLIGRKRLDNFMQWWLEKPPLFIRTWLVFGLFFGVFIYYAVS